jgi:hypothetical protein
MEFLRDLFGNFTSGMIRLAVAVGILAATYFFIVKPVLHTTENVSDTVNSSINQGLEESVGPNSPTAKALRRANRQVKIQITRAFQHAKHATGADPTRLLHCVQHANGDVGRMQRCTVKFGP